MNGDIVLLQNPAFGNSGSRKYQVAAGAAASINPGEPVNTTLGASTVAAAGDAAQVVATDFMVGISASTSTDTVAAAGEVYVFNLVPGQVYSIAPVTAASWDTQSEYNALVGDRVTINLTAGAYKLNATDGATNGVVVQNFDVTRLPGRVAIAFRNGLSNLA